jgi:hypothetical protein
MDTFGLLILAVVICYVFYKFWKKIIVLIIIGIVFGFIYVVSSVSNFITDITKGGPKQKTVQTEWFTKIQLPKNMFIRRLCQIQLNLIIKKIIQKNKL